jgi:hypothetical protein
MKLLILEDKISGETDRHNLPINYIIIVMHMMQRYVLKGDTETSVIRISLEFGSRNSCCQRHSVLGSLADVLMRPADRHFTALFLLIQRS